MNGTISTLDNGLQVLLVDQPGTAAATVATFVRAGWRHDPPGAVGTAHLTEHLLTVGARLLPRDLQTVGCDFDARSYADHLEFITRGPASILPSLLDVELERLDGRIATAQQEVGRQRAAVCEEIRALAESPSPWPALSPALHADHALGHEGFGELDDVADLDAAHCAQFVRHWVRPDRALLLVATDLTAVGGPTRLLQELRSRRPEPEQRTKAAASEEFPADHRGLAGDLIAAVEHPWTAWSVPGLTRDPTAHLRWALLADLLADLLGQDHPVRFGRSGVGYAADREQFVIGADPDEIRDSLHRLDLTGCARQAPRGWLSDPLVEARCRLFTGQGARAIQDSVDLHNPHYGYDLSDLAEELLSTEPVVLSPGLTVPATGARFSTDQHPTGSISRPIPVDLPRPTAVGQARRTLSPGVGGVWVNTPEPTEVRARVSGPVPSADGWQAVPDLLGHRVARTRPDAETPPTRYVVAVGREPLAHESEGPDDPWRREQAATDVAAQWLAIGALNRLDEVAAGGHAPIQALRVADPTAGHSVRPPITIVTNPSVSDDVPGWTPAYLERVRRLCVGQLVTATAQAGTEADLILSLAALGLDHRSEPLDLVGFAEVVEHTADEEIRRAAEQLLAQAQPLPA